MRVLLLTLPSLLPAAAEAGLRATYGREPAPPMVVEIADNETSPRTSGTAGASSSGAKPS